jgi:hypothetical protein
MLAHEKLVRYNLRSFRPFCEEFLKECVKHLILCKKFYLPQLMVVVQQFLLESLVFFQKHLHEIDKVPKMVALLKTVLDIDRQFYRLNAQTDYPHMVHYWVNHSLYNQRRRKLLRILSSYSD